MASKERKGLFNSFCANVVEETCKTEERARTAATKGLRDLFAELLNVTPLQFRLFREGKELEEVNSPHHSCFHYGFSSCFYYFWHAN